MVISDGIPAVPRNRNFRNSVSNPSVEEKTRIPFRGPKTEANSRNSLPNPSAEEKTSRNSVPLNRNRNKLSEFPSVEEKTTRNSVPLNRNRNKLSEFPSEPFSGRENNSEFRSLNKMRSKLSEFRSEPFDGRENNSEQNAATSVSDSIQIESSCRGCQTWTRCSRV